MHHYPIMNKAFESEKNRKALLYTTIICVTILLLFIIISWKVMPPTVPVVQDLIEINLGNEEEGFGDEQPLIKGNRTPVKENNSSANESAENFSETEKIDPDPNAEKDAAPVTKTEKITPKPKINKPVVLPTPVVKPQKPKITYKGPENGPPGNNPTEDNGYKNQGKDPNKTGDDGDLNGNKDSYGKTPGGKTGGPRVTQGNRKIVRYYSFTGDLNKATIYAVIKVSPSGQGTFIRLVKPSTSFEQGYATAISNYLRNIQFDKAAGESTVTVQFNFNVN